MSADGIDSNSSASIPSSEEESDVEENAPSPLREHRGGAYAWRHLGSAEGEEGTEAQFQEALDWCLDHILRERKSIITTVSDEHRQYEIALWDDELTRGGTVSINTSAGKPRTRLFLLAMSFTRAGTMVQ